MKIGQKLIGSFAVVALICGIVGDALRLVPAGGSRVDQPEFDRRGLRAQRGGRNSG